jgi:hypothetical protein
VTEPRRRRGRPSGPSVPLADDPDLGYLAYIHALAMGAKANGAGRIGHNAATNNAAVLKKNDLSTAEVERLRKRGRIDFPRPVLDDLSVAEFHRLKQKLGRLEREGTEAERQLLREASVRVLSRWLRVARPLCARWGNFGPLLISGSL